MYSARMFLISCNCAKKKKRFLKNAKNLNHDRFVVSWGGESNGSVGAERLSHSLPGSPADRKPNFEVIGSAESLVGRVSILQISTSKDSTCIDKKKKKCQNRYWSSRAWASTPTRTSCATRRGRCRRPST